MGISDCRTLIHVKEHSNNSNKIIKEVEYVKTYKVHQCSILYDFLIFWKSQVV